jgi:hypothetical protein
MVGVILRGEKPEYFQKTVPVEHTNIFAGKIQSFEVLQLIDS